MIVSRGWSTLIRLNHVIKLTTFAKSELLNSARLPVIKSSPHPGVWKITDFKAMSTNMESELNDPKRHFDYQQLVAKKDQENVVVIDVREHSEINETGKIPGSIHIPLNDLNHALNKLSNEEFLKLYHSEKPDVNSEIIFTCRSGRRSLTAMKCAFESGYLKAGNYKGGWLDWAEKTGQSK